MKHTFTLLLSFLVCTYTFSQLDPTIMEIDRKKVTKSEFLQIYLKNNNAPKYDKESLDEYIALFKKFKLKVAEAEALGYDTIPRLKSELAGYRKQLATPYLTDSSMNEALVKEAFDRISNELRASHLLLRLNPDSAPQDTLEVYNRIMKLRKQIIDGADFEAVAKGKNGSEDPSVATNGGDLGYFTAFQMVTPFEDAAYATPLGQVSMPVRTKFGYHLIKVVDKRPARGSITAAHIMVAKDKTMASMEEASLTARKKIDEIYDRLKKGENFEEMAKQFSDDPSTNSKGGILPIFGSGTSTRMVTNFEDAAFSIKEDGGIAAPIETDYGWHIIKRLNWTPLPPFDKMKKELQSKVGKDERAKRTQNAFVDKLKKEYEYDKKSASRVDYFKSKIDSSYFTGNFKANAAKKNQVLYKLDGKKIKQREFANYLESNYRIATKQPIANLVDAQYAEFEKSQILAYEESKLEEKYPAYKSLMQEYHDGILLYEIMSDKVWNKGMKDSVGLQSFFDQNRDNYKWGVRYDALVYECIDAKIANQVYDMIANDTVGSKFVIEKINAQSELNLRVMTNKYEVKQTPFLEGNNLQLGRNKPYEYEGKHYVVKVNEILPAGSKELKEAKGAVTSDYQNFLEKNWMEELAKKHPVKVYNEVLYSLGK